MANMGDQLGDLHSHQTISQSLQDIAVFNWQEDNRDATYFTLAASEEEEDIFGHGFDLG